MKILDIETDFPLIPRKSKIDPLVHKNAARMKVGDSFRILLGEEDKKLTHRGIGISLAGANRDNDKSFTCKMMKENEIRVWRVK